MAKDQATAAKLTGAAAIRELKDQLATMTLSDEMKAKILVAATEEHSGGAVDALVADLNKVINLDRHADAVVLLGGKKLNFSVVYPTEAAEGEEEATPRTSFRLMNASTEGGEGGTRGGSREVIVNGEKFPTAAAACEKFGIKHKGTSAPRQLRNALGAGQIQSLEFPSGESADDADEAEGIDEVAAVETQETAAE